MLVSLMSAVILSEAKDLCFCSQQTNSSGALAIVPNNCHPERGRTGAPAAPAFGPVGWSNARAEGSLDRHSNRHADRHFDRQTSRATWHQATLALCTRAGARFVKYDKGCYHSLTLGVVMEEVLHDRRRAITNTVLYAAFLLLAVVGLVTRQSWWGRGLMLLVVVWAIGGVKANWRAIRHGFVDLDR